MNSQALTMTDVDGRPITVTSYEEASKVMGLFHEASRRYAEKLRGDITSARQLLPHAQILERHFNENVKIYQHFAALADIRSAAAAMAHIAEQTKALHDKAP